MAEDDLSAPLGTAKPRTGRRLPDPAPIVAAIAGGVLMAGVVWAALIEDPLGGEPIAVATIERPRLQSAKTRQENRGDGAQSANNMSAAPDASPDAAAGTQAESTVPGGPMIIKVPQSGGTAARGADPALVEESKYGPLPKIAADGRRPADVFAATSIAQAEDRRPKIAILLGGLGVSREQTADVLEKLPRTITLAFTPYGEGLEGWAAKARENGHEIMLQVPMEPFDYPNNDPGPQTLLTSLPSTANIERLNWAMSRMSGYFGLTSFMGAKFTTSEAALAPVLTETGRRGLVFLDNLTSPRGVIDKLGPETGAATARAELVIDANPEAGAIDAALAKLEEQARREGAVIGVASALPVTISRLEHWASQLTAKGIALVPVSAVVKRSNPS